MLELETPDQRIVQGLAATLRFENTDAEGVAEATSGTVTVGIVDDAGTEVQASIAATDATGGEWTFNVTPAQTATLASWIVTWTDTGDSSVHRRTVEVAGALLFTLSQAQDQEKQLASTPNSAIIAARMEAEIEAEYICGRSFVPRHRLMTFNGSGELTLPIGFPEIRTITAVTVDGTALTSTQIAALTIDGRDIVRSTSWPAGHSNIVVAFEEGMTSCPAPVRRAAITRCREIIGGPKSQFPGRATTASVEGLGTIQLAQASMFKTGNDEVDAIYARASARISSGADGGGDRPVSIPFDADPSSDSLFHGGRR